MAQYCDVLEAPRGKQLIWFEQSGHWPQLDEAAKFQKVMVERVPGENRKSKDAAIAPEYTDVGLAQTNDVCHRCNADRARTSRLHTHPSVG